MPNNKHPWLAMPYPLGPGISHGGTSFEVIDSGKGDGTYIGICKAPGCGWISAPRKGGWPFGTHFIIVHQERSAGEDRRRSEKNKDNGIARVLSSSQLGELADIIENAKKDRAEAERLREILICIKELLEEV